MLLFYPSFTELLDIFGDGVYPFICRLQLLPLIQHDGMRLKINSKLGSLGSQLQFSKYVSKQKYLILFEFY
jgi:hypothetical protein